MHRVPPHAVDIKGVGLRQLGCQGPGRAVSALLAGCVFTEDTHSIVTSACASLKVAKWP